MSGAAHIRRGMSNADYHASPALGSSGLSALAKSPAHYHALYINDQRPAREPTAAMRAGTAEHCAILEPEAFGQRYITKPEDVDTRTKAGKAWAEALPEGVEVITADDMARLDAQRAAVLAVPELAGLLADGEAEVSAFWVDGAENNVAAKCRPDWVHTLSDGRVILLDLKTTADVSPTGFARSIWNFGYHRQAAWYSRGFAKASGAEVAAFVFAAVSSKYPYIAMPYMLDDDATAKGAAHCDELVALYAGCNLLDAWPAFGTGVHVLSLPAWAK